MARSGEDGWAGCVTGWSGTQLQENKMPGRHTAAAMVADAKTHIENLTPQQMEPELHRNDVVIVDIREPEELVETGCIPGSIHLPRGMLEFRADPTSPYHDERMHPSKRVVVHCASGGRSALAAEMLREELDYTDVAHLDGGMKAWREAGGAVIGPPALSIGDRLTRAINSRDMEAVLSCYREDAVVVDPAGACEGHDEICNLYQEWFDMFSSFLLVDTTRMEVGDTAAFEWALTGKAGGADVHVMGADFCRVEDGLIVHHQMYYDVSQLAG
jgi:rhodanese-related sulfurtransferase/ketosteroid isomerase-like protein